MKTSIVMVLALLCVTACTTGTPDEPAQSDGPTGQISQAAKNDSVSQGDACAVNGTDLRGTFDIKCDAEGTHCTAWCCVTVEPYGTGCTECDGNNCSKATGRATPDMTPTPLPKR